MQTFRGYIVTLDYKNSKIILKKGDLNPSKNTIPINLDHILEAKIFLNNKEVLAHFDCGAPGYIAIPKRWNNIYALKSEPILHRRGRTPMGDFDIYNANLNGDVKIGNYEIKNPAITLVTGDFFFAVNFGYDFFKDNLISIDTKNMLMEIHPISKNVQGNIINQKQIDEINSLVENLSKNDDFSGTVLIAKDDKILYQKAVGMSDKIKKIKNDINTKFNLASMNKMFTSVAIAQLVEKNKLAYSDKITKYLPQLPSSTFGEITIDQLLTHSSGLGDFFDNPKFFEIKDTAKTLNTYLMLGMKDTLHSVPGSMFRYSNYGFILLGAAIEKISNMNYFDYIKKNIYELAEMNNSDSYETDKVNQNLAIGYARIGMPMQNPENKPIPAEESPREPNTQMIEVKGTSAGGGYSTAIDLMQFSSALLNGKLISKKSLETISTGKISLPQRPLPPGMKPQIEIKYGYGFGEFYKNKTRIIGHNGGAPGVEGQVDIYPDLGYTVIALSNYDRSTMPIMNLIQNIITQSEN
jgi:CubicO group peptidase (beta-lactamase class C family)